MIIANLSHSALYGLLLLNFGIFFLLYLEYFEFLSDKNCYYFELAAPQSPNFMNYCSRDHNHFQLHCRLARSVGYCHHYSCPARKMLIMMMKEGFSLAQPNNFENSGSVIFYYFLTAFYAPRGKDP